MVRSRTYIATPPGSTIKEQIKDRGLQQKEFAARMDMSEKHISNLINGNVRLTPDVAERLEMVLGIPASFWNNLEAIYQEKIAKAKAENAMDEDTAITKKFPYSKMANFGWVPETKKKIERAKNLRKFFEVVNLSLIFDKRVSVAYRKLGRNETSDYSLIAWAQKAKIEARNLKTDPINVKGLMDDIPRIREMTTMQPEVFCEKLVNLLAGHGVALVFLPHIGGSFLHGATFYDEKRIVMGMTVRGMYADRFWFSLFHELAHIICGHLDRESGILEEAEADNFSRDTLIDPQDYKNFLAGGNFSKESMICGAKKMGIDVGILVGRLQKEGYIPYSMFNVLKTKYVIVD